ncbi:DUF3806 domain-containing protein [Corynebacterium lubricantis]|uniref:DUF3806 domain-containing protein n=1 Tax=Corynebacterium lubricantis TaxID=541095 RepID=UPI000368F9D7|nr:DUF3806 domain-containing protein [Corynebacterium lubricantis]
MTFSRIDESTSLQLTRDLAEAAVRGINGSVADIVASFEADLGEYLALDPDLKQEFPRGETARIYGTALGDALTRELDLTWQILSDDYGTDLVVADSTGEKYTAPLIVVDSRFDDDETGKLTAFIDRFLA